MATYSDGARKYILAHRGGGGNKVPENSIKAFQRAHSLGVRYIETDVRLAADGKLYLVHGATSLLPNRPLRLNGKKLNTLDELFGLFPDCFFAIDPKHDLAVKPLARLIVESNMANRICIGSSFDRRSKQVADEIERISGKRPDIALVSVMSTILLVMPGTLLGKRKKALGAKFIHVHKALISPRLIRRSHKLNLKIIGWTVNDTPTMSKLISWNIDGFMTDLPEKAIDYDHC
jgi:glycerophosphoryl diester phosphodiesterase